MANETDAKRKATHARVDELFDAIERAGDEVRGYVLGILAGEPDHGPREGLVVSAESVTVADSVKIEGFVEVLIERGRMFNAASRGAIVTAMREREHATRH